MNNLEQISDAIRHEMEDIDQAREMALKRSRALIRICAKAIRAMHRDEWEKAEELLATTRDAAATLIDGTTGYPALYHAGYTQDSLKEYVEAQLVYALMQDHELPGHQALNVKGSTWLGGLSEAATELRRRILDLVRFGKNEEAERLMGKMDDVYSILVTFDFPDSITGGLRRRTDAVRAVLERTRGDVTNSIRQSELKNALLALESKLGVNDEESMGYE